MTFNKDRYQYDSSLPLIKQPAYELYEGIDLLKNSSILVATITIPPCTKKQRTFRVAELRHLASLLKSLQPLRHPNLSPIHQLIVGQQQLIAILEVCQFGPIQSFLTSELFLEQQLAVHLMRQLCTAVKSLHDQNIVHGYINPETVAIDGNGACKLTARRLILQRNCLPPEYKMGGKRIKEGDIFALGALFFRMLFGVYPFPGVTDKELNQNIANGSFRINSTIQTTLPCQLMVSKELRKLITEMLSYEPGKRPTIEKVLQTLGIEKVDNTGEKNKRFPKQVDTNYFVFDFKEKIQHGPYYKQLIFTAINRQDHSLVKLKVLPINKEQDESALIYRFVSKLQFFKNVYKQPSKSHLRKSFICVLQHYLTQNSLILILEYYNQNTLADYSFLKKDYGYSFVPRDVDQIILYLSEALQLYHLEIQSYFWLSPYTILIKQGRIKIGTPALEFDNIRKAMTKMADKYDYLANQKKLNKNAGQECDTWSIGVVKYWLLTGEFPEFDAMKNVVLPPSKNFTVNDKAFFKECIKLNPKERKSLNALTITPPPVAKIAAYYKIPESQVKSGANGTLQTTISQHMLLHSEANEQAQLKLKPDLSPPKPSRPQKYPQMSWLQRKLFFGISSSKLQKRNYFISISQRTNPKLRAFFKTVTSSLLFTLLFYLFFIISSSTLIYRSRSLSPLTVPLISNNTVMNNYTVLTYTPQYFTNRNFTIFQIRDEMSCINNLYFNPNIGGNVVRISEYILGMEFVGLVVLGYLLIIGHFVMQYIQYRQLDLTRIVAGVKKQPLTINQMARMIMCTMGSSSLIALHYIMLGSYYHFSFNPCMTSPQLPAAKWTFSGRLNYYLLFIIGVITAYISICYLSFRPLQERMNWKTLVPLLIIYLIGVGLRAFGGFAFRNSTDVWVSLCGVLPEFLHLIVFLLTELFVDVPFWCHMRWSRLKNKNKAIYDETYLEGDASSST